MRRMKDSGVAWIGEIPEGWETLPFVRVIKERVSGNWGSEPTPATDNIICVRVADFDFSKFSILDKNEYTQRGYKKNESLSMLNYGDILFEKSGGGQTTPVGRAIFFDKKMEATHSNFIDKLRVHDTYSNKFIFYYILIGYLTTYSNMYIKQTTGIQNFDLTNFLAKERICLPQLPEQHRIASYLDTKCAEIDRSMELVRQGIDKLKEYKKSVITEAVTKGLDPDVPMKDSGVPWIGVIPQHWEVEPIKYLYDNSNGNAVCVGPFGSSLPSSEICDTGIWVYNQRVILDNNFDTNSICINEKKAKELSGFSVNPGDILITTRGSIGKIAIVPPTAHPGILHPCVIRFRINIKKYNIKLLKYIFNESDISLQQINYMNNSTTIGVLYSYSLKEIKLPAPPLTEQDTIASYLDAKCAEIDTLIAQKQALLDKLAEYKKSLIFECVTGKREVPA